MVLRKLRQFQDLGHVAVLIIGDFTARVGDPSGRSATRPPLTPEQVDAHATSYVDQVQGILDFTPGRIEVVRNSSWLAPMDMVDVLRLTARTTVARIMERDDFSTRFAEGSPIALSELLYPLLQATDSVEVRADVELGGTDQLFNILMGRHLQSQAGQDPQVVLTTPLLEGLDGVQKMSKSLGNYIGIAEPPGEQFGKLMSIPDALMPRYFQLTTGWLPEQVEATLEDLRTGALTPVAAKRLLARTVVDLYHGDGAGEQAEAEFDRVFKDHAVPTDVEEREVAGSDLPTAVVPAPGARRPGHVGQGRPPQDRAGRGAPRPGEGDRPRPGGHRRGHRRPADLGGEARPGRRSGPELGPGRESASSGRRSG